MKMAVPLALVMRPTSAPLTRSMEVSTRKRLPGVAEIVKLNWLALSLAGAPPMWEGTKVLFAITVNDANVRT